MERDLLSYIVEKYGISEAVAPLLIKKGILTRNLVDITFNPEIKNLAPPETLPDYDKALNKIFSSGRKVRVWGHEDGDGVSATVVLHSALKRAGFEVDDYIPSKSEESHGLSFIGIDRAIEDGIGLIITVDCGSTNLDEIDYALSKGIGVIVTDHHELPKTPPPVPFINPKRGGGSFPYLAGVGVAFKLAFGILSKSLSWDPVDVEREMPELFVLTAVGTQTDRVPLISENRALHRRGISLFYKISLPLFDEYQKLKDRKIDWETFVSLIASGKSVSGRNSAVKLLLSTDRGEIENLLEEMLEALELWNRRAEDIFEKALSRVKRIHKYILLDLEDTDPHFLGVVASRLKDKFEVPVIVLGRKDDGKIVAEVRTPYGLNSLSLLDSLSHLLEDYGGHKQASGFSMNPSHLAALVEEVELFFREYKGDKELPDVDLTIESGENGKILEDLVRLGKLGLDGRVLWKNPPQEIKEKFSIDSDNLFLKVGEGGVNPIKI
jgi:single-stranded-DNA-specific exonuclease